MAKTSSAMKRSSAMNAGGGGGGASASNIRADQNSTTEIVQRRTINRTQARQEFLESRNPSDFLPENVPDSININGVEFRRFSTSESLDSDGYRRYVSAFQATQQAQDGTYPVFETVVKNIRKRGKSSFQFDSSVSGVKFW